MSNKVKVVNKKGVPLPVYSTSGAAGMDVYAAYDYIILPSEVEVIMTGLHVELPKGYELQVRSRSGWAAKYNVCVANGIGTIDEVYRGEIGVILANHGSDKFIIKKGDRVAQLVLSKVEHVEWVQVGCLNDTVRGSGGFGSTNS